MEMTMHWSVFDLILQMLNAFWDQVLCRCLSNTISLNIGIRYRSCLAFTQTISKSYATDCLSSTLRPCVSVLWGVQSLDQLLVAPLLSAPLDILIPHERNYSRVLLSVLMTTYLYRDNLYIMSGLDPYQSSFSQSILLLFYGFLAVHLQVSRRSRPSNFFRELSSKHFFFTLNISPTSVLRVNQRNSTVPTIWIFGKWLNITDR